MLRRTEAGWNENRRGRRRPARRWDRDRPLAGSNGSLSPDSQRSACSSGIALSDRADTPPCLSCIAREAALLIPREPQPQLLRDVARDLFLDREDVGELAVVLFAPELSAVADVDQLRLNRQAIGELCYASGNDRLDLQLISDVLRVRIFPLEAEHRAARHHLELWKLRHAVDDAFRDAVAQVVALRIIGCVHERQHGQRVDRWGPRTARSGRAKFPDRCRDATRENDGGYDTHTADRPRRVLLRET